MPPQPGGTATKIGTTGSAVRPAAAPATTPRAPVTRELTPPAGTALPLELVGSLSSASAQVQTSVRARWRQAVSVDGYTLRLAGAVFRGRVPEVARAGLLQGRSRLAFGCSEVEVNGTRREVLTNPLVFEGEATRGENATKIGAGAIGGAIIGGIVGGAAGRGAGDAGT